MNAIVNTKPTINGKPVDVPAKTFAVVSAIEELEKIEADCDRKVISMIDCIRAEYNFLVSLYGQEIIDEAFDNVPLDEIDCNEVTVGVLNVLSAIKKPVEDAKMKQATSKLNRPEIKRIVDIVKTASKS